MLYENVLNPFSLRQTQTPQILASLFSLPPNLCRIYNFRRRSKTTILPMLQRCRLFPAVVERVRYLGDTGRPDVYSVYLAHLYHVRRPLPDAQVGLR